jgi:hypothetical protein
VSDPADNAGTLGDYLTVDEIASMLRVSTDTVIRTFAGRPGVLELGRPETMHKRRYRVLRIPRSVLDKYLRDAGAR